MRRFCGCDNGNLRFQATVKLGGCGRGGPPAPSAPGPPGATKGSGGAYRPVIRRKNGAQSAGNIPRHISTYSISAWKK
jgi:hypothetical protein